MNFISGIAQKRGMILFVGTKRSARDAVKEEAERCGMPYMTQSWLGGTLTNFATVKKSVSRLKELEAGETDGSFDKIDRKSTSMNYSQKCGYRMQSSD